MSSSRLVLAALLGTLASCDPQDVNDGDFLFAATVRASLGPARGQGDDASISPAISADGRYVVFTSRARNLVALDTGGLKNIFRRDIKTGVTELVSVGLGGAAADADSQHPSISGDGNFVAFDSDASNLVAGDAGFPTDVFVRDIAAGTTIRVTESTFGGEANGDSYNPAISADGAYVAFESLASDLVPGGTAGLLQQVFRRALPAGPVDLVSVDEAGAEAAGGSVGGQQPSISADGSVLAFSSDIPLTADDFLPFFDVFVRDFNAVGPPFIARVSLEAGGGPPFDDSSEPSISSDGRYVAFTSYATDIIAPDTNGTSDVYCYDRQADQTIRVSVNSDGVQGNDVSSEPSISGDGRTIAFGSGAVNLVSGDSNGTGDIFLRDLGKGTTIRLSISTLGSQTSPLEPSQQPALSRDGRFCAFVSKSDLLVNDDTNGLDDIFVRGPLR